MKGSPRKVSRSHSIICPVCESGELHQRSTDLARCDSCDRVFDACFMEYLRQVVTLPDIIGAHACECGHPEMRRLPDGWFWCPACGSDLLPATYGGSPEISQSESDAYWAGWLDGRFNQTLSMADNARLVTWTNELDRIDYYRGHREGQEARERRNHDLPEVS